MEIANINKHLGYCGINCAKCFAYFEGPIKENSGKLKNSLGNFTVYAERFSELLNEPVFKKYREFKELLDYFVSMHCRACRLDGCMIFKSCNVRACAIEKEVDYCFQCSDFPCQNTGFDEHLKQRWMSINNEMKKVGIKAYYERVKDKPRY
jgi:hypothetical protein